MAYNLVNMFYLIPYVRFDLFCIIYSLFFKPVLKNFVSFKIFFSLEIREEYFSHFIRLFNIFLENHNGV